MTFVVHLMQGGRLKEEPAPEIAASSRPAAADAVRTGALRDGPRTARRLPRG